MSEGLKICGGVVTLGPKIWRGVSKGGTKIWVRPNDPRFRHPCICCVRKVVAVGRKITTLWYIKKFILSDSARSKMNSKGNNCNIVLFSKSSRLFFHHLNSQTKISFTYYWNLKSSKNTLIKIIKPELMDIISCYLLTPVS